MPDRDLQISLAQIQAKTILRSNHHVSSCCDKEFAVKICTNCEKIFPTTQVNLSSGRFFCLLHAKYHKIRVLTSRNSAADQESCKLRKSSRCNLQMFSASGQALRFSKTLHALSESLCAWISPFSAGVK